MYQVNSYPDERTFKAIGSGIDFADKIVQAVASVTGSQGQERVVCRPSAGGKYISVTIGPVLVQTPEQVSNNSRSYFSTRVMLILMRQARWPPNTASGRELRRNELS